MPFCALIIIISLSLSNSIKNIVVWERMHPLAPIGSHPGTIVSLLVLGDTLVSVCEEGRMKCWDLKHGSLLGRKHRQNKVVEGSDGILLMELSLGKGLRPTALMHPDTYLNKVVVGFSDGSLSLWNIRSGKLVHQFKGVNPELDIGSVTAIEQSPALDVVAVGMQDGTVFLLNLKQDIVLFELDSGKSAVTSLSFRTDNGGGDNSCPVLASGCADGKIWIWDLAGKKLIGEVAAPLGAHEGRILSASFLPQEPVSAVYVQVMLSYIYIYERGSLFNNVHCCFLLDI
jgi:U3 small nucleolar RNA-associated protein 21